MTPMPEPLRRQIDHFAAQAGHRTVEEVMTNPQAPEPREPRRFWMESDR